MKSYSHLLAIALLICSIQISMAAVSSTSMSYRTPSKQVITSPKFPIPYSIADRGTPDVYAWSLVNMSPRGRIRLFFTDYDLNELSLIRVYQSSNVSGTSTVWRHNDIRPIIRSTGNALLVVFKVGRQSIVNENIGFRADVQYVEAKNGYEEITTSPCGSITEYVERVSGVMSLSGVAHFTLHGSYLYNCVWSRRLRSDISYVALRVTSPSSNTTNWLEDGRLTVHQGPASYYDIANALSYHDEYKDTVVFRMWYSQGFYISFEGIPHMDDHIMMAYHETKDEALELLKTLSPTENRSTCPYKQCGDRCVHLWEACYDDYEGDPSCEYSDPNLQQCGHPVHRCYLTDVDTCDHYDDCGNYADEANCDHTRKHWLVGVLQDAGILCGFLLLLWFLDVLCTHPSRRRTRKILPCANTCSNSSIDLSSCYYRNIIARIRAYWIARVQVEVDFRRNGSVHDLSASSNQGKASYYFIFGVFFFLALGAVVIWRISKILCNNFCQRLRLRVGRPSRCHSSCQYCGPVRVRGTRSHSTMRQEPTTLPPATVISVSSPPSSQSSDSESLEAYGASGSRSSEAAASPPDYNQVTASDTPRSSEGQPQGQMPAPPSYEEAVTQLPKTDDVPPPAYDSLSPPQNETTV